MTNNYDADPFVGFFKARMLGASAGEALSVMGRLCDEAGAKAESGQTQEPGEGEGASASLSIELIEAPGLPAASRAVSNALRHATPDKVLLRLDALGRMLDDKNSREVLMNCSLTEADKRRYLIDREGWELMTENFRHAIRQARSWFEHEAKNGVGT